MLLALRTVRHLRFRQLLAQIRRRLPIRFPPDPRHAEPFAPPRLLPAPPPPGAFDPRFRAFAFLGERAAFPPGRIDWSGGGRPPLWVYNLHYHDGLNAREIDPASASMFLRDWLERCPPRPGPAWDPYPISLRAVNWIRFLAARGETLDPDLRAALTRSLQHQGRVLAGRIEYHLMGNHLLANAKALLFLGAAFRGSDGDRWWGRGLRLLAREIREQILADGGHFEETQAYHAIILFDVLDILDLFGAADRPPPTEGVDRLRETAARMLAWHTAMLHPDGEVALFNDSGFGIARPVRSLLAHARALGVPAPPEPRGAIDLRDTRYHVFREGPIHLAFDGGGTGPAYQPGHHHADALSYELDLDGRRVAVDRGTFGYTGSPDRLGTRRSCSHNTLTADGADHAEVWDNFRVARRMRPLAASLAREGHEVAFQGAVRAFPALGYGIHTRRACLTLRGESEGALRVEDAIRGLGPRDLASRVHLHPKCEVRREGDRVLVARAGWRLEVKPLGSARIAIGPYHFHPAFGESIEACVLCVMARGEAVGYEIAWRRGGG